jgi:hypothetical protein
MSGPRMHLIAAWNFRGGNDFNWHDREEHGAMVAGVNSATIFLCGRWSVLRERSHASLQPP